MTSSGNSLSYIAISSFLMNTKAKTTQLKEQTKLACFCKFTFGTGDILGADWSKLSKSNILAFISHKIDTVQFSTANNYIMALQSLAAECYNQGAIDSTTYNQIKSIKKYKGIAPDNGRALTTREISKVKLYFSKGRNARELRNFAIFALAVGCGLRRAEISALNIEDIKNKKLQIKGKGNKARNTYLSKFTFDALMAWRKQLPKTKGALFVHVSKGDQIKSERLGVKGIHYVTKSIHVDCKMNSFTTHDLRRTFATTLLHANNDIFTVQDLLGHSDPMTTKRYDKRDEQGKIKAINSLPY